MSGRRAIVLGAVLVMGGLGGLYLGAFHAWVAGGPPTANPEWHLRWAYVFLAGGVCSLVGLTALAWQWRREIKEGFDKLTGAV